MARRSTRGTISRPTLIWIVVAAFLFASGLGVYFAIRKGSRSAAPAGAPINLDTPPPPSLGTGSGPVQSENGRAQFVDRKDPNRLAGEMLYRKLDPLPRGRYALDQPQLWLFNKDGTTLHLVAKEGNVKFFPGTERPESGRFEGGAIVRMYAKGVATADRRPDPRQVAPVMLAYTDSMVFDLSVSEFTTEDVVNMSTPDMELQGEGLSVVFNEIRDSVARVELGAVGYLHVKGGRDPKIPPTTPPPAPAPEAAPSPTVTPAPAPTTPPKPPKIDLYAVNISGPVSLSVGTTSPQSISADRLLLWARLIDGALPPGAIAELRSKTEPATPSQPDQPIAGAGAAPPVQEAQTPPVAETPRVVTGPGLRERIRSLRINGPDGIEPLTPIHEEDALLTWGGRLVAIAVDEQPAELEVEHVAARFVSESSEPVMLMDARTGATVLAGAAHYRATTAGAELIGKDGKPITIADSREGHGELPALTLNLKTGIGQSRGGPGFFDRRDSRHKGDAGLPAPPPHERLSWTDQADFIFDTGSRTGSGLQSIREAWFTGAVTGVTSEAEISGDYLKAWFSPSKARDALLSRVVITGNALGRTIGSQEPQRLRAERFDVAFKPNEAETDVFPARLVAVGAVSGERTEMIDQETPGASPVPRRSSLTSDSLIATLAPDAKDNVVVTDAVATGNASFHRSDDISAEGDEIRANVADKSADVTGEKAVVRARGAALAGPDLHLDGAKNAVIAKGPGRLDHIDPNAAKLEPGERSAIPADQIGVTTLTWTKGMRFDDSTGLGEAIGEVHAVTHPDPFTQNTVRGEKLIIRTASAESKPDEPASNPLKGEGDPLKDLQLLSAEAIAPEPSGPEPTKATAEQRIYVVDDAAPGGRRLEKLTYIEGPRLVADDEHGTFTVPAAGRALVLDHSVANEAKPAAGSSPLASVNSQGTTLMEWSGNMTMSRVTELADAMGGVRITHKPLSSSNKPVVLEADSVQARFRLATKNKATANAAPSGDAPRDQLVSATARGAVRITTDMGNKELTADEATYHVVDEIIEASATDPNSGVTFLDKTKGVPTIARKLRWNLKTDAIEIIQPMPTAAPFK